jgi:AbrB family looped-hinge helix DNA binding protein
MDREEGLPAIVTLDAKGRVVVPKSIREILGVEEGSPLKISINKLRVPVEG